MATQLIWGASIEYEKGYVEVTDGGNERKKGYNSRLLERERAANPIGDKK